MGWKTLKQTFGITHNVQVTQAGICIGSGYVHDLAVIDPETGIVLESRTFGDFVRKHYPDLHNAKASDILAAIQAEDVFEKSITVYTYKDDQILERLCEEPGFPNVTHCGEMMYENTHSTDKRQVIEWAKKDLMLAIKGTDLHIIELNQKLQRATTMKAEKERLLVSLLDQHPATEEEALR